MPPNHTRDPLRITNSEKSYLVPCSPNIVRLLHAELNGIGLNPRWALWYDNAKLKAPTETWAENLKHIMAFDSVEDFWGLFNNVMPPSMLSVRSLFVSSMLL